MKQKKIIIFGCSFAPFLIVIAGAITYFASSKNNVHQNNLQLKKEKKEDLQNVNEEKKEIKSDINSPEKIEKKEEKKEKSIKNQKVLIKNQNQEEEYIPFLDNTKIQMGLWFIYYLITTCYMDGRKSKEYYDDLTENISINFTAYVSLINALILCLIVVPLCFLAGEFIVSFIVYLPACWINKKPWKKAFSVYHRFWWQSWTNVLWTILIIELFGFIDFTLLWPILNYGVGFLGSFFEKSEQNDQKDFREDFF